MFECAPALLYEVVDSEFQVPLHGALAQTACCQSTHTQLCTITNGSRLHVARQRERHAFVNAFFIGSACRAAWMSAEAMGSDASEDVGLCCATTE